MVESPQSENPRFDCPACEFQSRRQDVSYDALGYPVCPVCGTRHAPLVNEGDATPDV